MKSRILALTLLLGLVLRLCLLFLQDPNLVIDLFFFDDSFYLLNIARNIADGNGITHDGIHMTNGFQPLYVLALIPVFWVAETNRIFPIYFAAVFLSICNVLSAYFCFRIVDRLVNTKAAYCSLLFTLFSPIALNYSLNGAETSLAVMLFLAAAYVYIRDIQYVRLSDCPLRKLILFGLLLGLAVLARIDMLILIFAVGIDAAYFHMRSIGAIKGDLKRFLVLSSVVTIVVAPWFAYNLACFHSLIPLSGKAVRQIATVRNPHIEVVRPISIEADTESESAVALLKKKIYSNKKFLFYRKLALTSCHVLEDFAHFPDWVNFYWKLASRHASRLPGIGKYLQLPSKIPVFPLIILICPIPLLWHRKNKVTDNLERAKWNIERSLFLLLFSFTLILSYMVKVPGFWFFKRYYAPIYYVGVIFLSLFLFMVFDLLRSKNPLIRYATATVLILSILAPWFLGIRAGIENWQKKDALCTYPGIISHVKSSFDRSNTFGAYQSGYFSYFMEQTVHNLDGVVNPKAMKAVEQWKIDEYIFGENIDYLIDTTVQMRIILRGYPRLKARTTALELNEPSLFSIYKIDRSVDHTPD